MANPWVKRFVIAGSTGNEYLVSQRLDGTYGCNCIGWTRHVPRKDCKHIRQAIAGQANQYREFIHAPTFFCKDCQKEKTDVYVVAPDHSKLCYPCASIRDKEVKALERLVIYEEKRTFRRPPTSGL